MAFFEELFPPEISVGMSGGPVFKNRKAYTGSGLRYTNREALYPLHQYTLGNPAMSQAMFERLRAFFWVVGGDADAFRFKDWGDFRATRSTSTITPAADGFWQLARLYRFGARSFTRPIVKPSAVARIWRTRNDVATDITPICTYDLNSGLATLPGHQEGDAYAWEGEFHVPAAFRDPGAMWTWLGNKGSAQMQWPSLEIEEVRL